MNTECGVAGGGDAARRGVRAIQDCVIGLIGRTSMQPSLPRQPLLSMAMADTVAPTYQTKFASHFWRPATAIREADTDGNPNTDPDPGWSPRAGGIGGTPEHWSGHSSFSGAAARGLAGFFCQDNISFTLVTDSAPGGQPRTYLSFSAAET